MSPRLIAQATDGKVGRREIRGHFACVKQDNLTANFYQFTSYPWLARQFNRQLAWFDLPPRIFVRALLTDYFFLFIFYFWTFNYSTVEQKQMYATKRSRFERLLWKNHVEIIRGVYAPVDEAAVDPDSQTQQSDTAGSSASAALVNRSCSGTGRYGNRHALGRGASRVCLLLGRQGKSRRHGPFARSPFALFSSDLSRSFFNPFVIFDRIVLVF